jgi:hypothetical protein
LHALPRAKGFYEGFGMKGFGPDAEKEALEYFEMASDKALEVRDRFMNRVSEK